MPTKRPPQPLTRPSPPAQPQAAPLRPNSARVMGILAIVFAVLVAGMHALDVAGLAALKIEIPPYVFISTAVSMAFMLWLLLSAIPILQWKQRSHKGITTWAGFYLAWLAADLIIGILAVLPNMKVPGADNSAAVLGMQITAILTVLVMAIYPTLCIYIFTREPVKAAFSVRPKSQRRR